MTNTVSEIVSDETLDCIIHIESRGNPRAKAPTSSATGLFQFLDATWLGTVRQHRPDVFSSTPKARLLMMRTDPVFCIEMGARFTEDNHKALGGDPTGGDLYLAHFLGIADARDFFRADPMTPASSLVSDKAVQANRSIFLNANGSSKTAGQVRAWAAKKMHEARGHGYIARYFKPKPEDVPLPEPRPDDAPSVDDFPDPQDAPTAVVPVDAPPEVVEKRVEESAQRDAETSPSWIKRQWRKVTGAVGGFLGIGTGFVFDWKLMAVIIGAMFIVFIFMIWFMGPRTVREWIRKQVS